MARRPIRARRNAVNPLPFRDRTPRRGGPLLPPPVAQCAAWFSQFAAIREHSRKTRGCLIGVLSRPFRPWCRWPCSWGFTPGCRITDRWPSSQPMDSSPLPLCSLCSFVAKFFAAQSCAASLASGRRGRSDSATSNAFYPKPSHNCWPAADSSPLTPRPSKRSGRFTSFSRPSNLQPSR